jgi:hypothetical protein
VTETSPGAPATADVGNYPIVPGAATFSTGLSSNYSITYASGTLTITPASPSVVWGTPADITYGMPLGAAQLDAAVSVIGPAPAGGFTYDPPAGTILHAGAGQTLTVIVAATPDYRPAVATVTINVLKATPTVSWPSPADIASDTALGAAQLDATASVPGTFTYTPAAGTALSPGQGQVLSVRFVPADAADYTTAAGSTTINVAASSPSPSPSPTPTPTPAPAPPQLAATPVAGRSRKGMTSISLRFNEALDPSSASNTSLYQVLGAVKKHRKTAYSMAVAIKSVVYDNNKTVTIHLAKPCKRAVQVTVQRGLRAANGASSSDSCSNVVH